MDTSQENPQLAAWYDNLVIICNIAKRDSYGIACHPSGKAGMMDFMERVLEDEMFKHDDLPPLLVHSDVRPGEFQFVDEVTMKVMNFQAAMQSNTGIGRFAKMWSPDESMKRLKA